MIMKRWMLPFIFLIGLFSYAQEPAGFTLHCGFFNAPETVGGTVFYKDAALGTYSYTDSEKLKILEKQYLTAQYESAQVDRYASDAYLRYNLFNGQMEFSKGGIIYYLKKEEGRTVHFLDSNTLYKVYKLHGDLEFLKVAVEGEYSLLVKQSKKFIPPKNRRSSYGHHIKADFKRNKDAVYLKIPDGNLVKIPSKKTEFFALFGQESNEVEAYMQKNKLGFRKVEDLKKLINYLNSWSNEVQKG